MIIVFIKLESQNEWATKIYQNINDNFEKVFEKAHF